MSKPEKYAPAAWGMVPLVPIVVALGLGILSADLLGYTPPSYWLIFGGILSLPVLFGILRPRPGRWYTIVNSGLVLLLVFTFGGWRANTTYPPGKSTFFVKHLQPGDLLSATVTSVRPGRKNLRAQVSVKTLLNDSLGNRAVTGQLLLYLPPDEQATQLKAGTKLVFDGAPSALRPPLNPGVFDLRAYWHRQGIYHQLFLRQAGDWRISGQAAGSLRARAEGWRRAWFKTFQAHLSGDQLAVAAALVMGKRDLISSEVKSAYTETGAVHVLAVSGLHVGIIFLLLRFLLVTLMRLDRTRAGRIGVALLSIVCVWAFALVSGLSPSVQRAAIMFSVLALGGLAYFKSSVFNNLSVAAIIMLAVSPGQLFQVGFQLSFTAIIGIVAFTDHLNRLVYLPGKVLRSAWSAISASTGAQLGTLPLSLLYFKQFPAYFLLSGTIVILFAFATMMAGLAHGFMAGILGFSTGAKFTGWLLSTIVGWQNALIFFFQGLPGALLRITFFDGVAAVLLALGIGLLAVFLRWRRRTVLLAGGLCFTAMLIWAGTRVQGEVGEGMVTVFHLSRATLVDFVTPETAFSLGQQPSAENMDWSAGPQRKAFRYTPTVTLSADQDTTIGSNFTLEDQRFTFQGEYWLILNGNSPGVAVPSFATVDYCLVVNGFKPSSFPTLPADNTPLLIIDGSNPYYRLDEWRELALERDYPIHITTEDGAFIRH